MLVCDTCKKFLENNSFHSGRVKDGYCSPGYNSRHDCDSERIRVDLPNGDYCYDCMDAAIDKMEVTHIQPRYRHEALQRLLYCDCDIHAGTRKTGGDVLIALLKLYGFPDALAEGRD